jgi:TonB family protein
LAGAPSSAKQEITSVVIQPDGTRFTNGKKGFIKNAKPTFSYSPFPTYPFEARKLHLTGVGIYRILVVPSGAVRAVEIRKSTGHDSLDSAAIAALKTWKAYPGVERSIDTPISFDLSSSSPKK